MAKTLNREFIRIRAQLLGGRGLRLAQAFRVGDPSSAIPVDQIVIGEANERKALMLPSGRYWLRTIDRDSKVIAEAQISVP